MSSQALKAYSSKPSSREANIIQALFPERDRHNCRFGNSGNSRAKLSTCSVVVYSQMPLELGCFTLSRKEQSSFSSRYKLVNPNQCFMVGRIALSSSRTKGNGSRRFFEALLFIILIIDDNLILRSNEPRHFVNRSSGHFFLREMATVFKDHQL